MRGKNVRGERNTHGDFPVYGSPGCGAEDAVAPGGGVGDACLLLISLDGFLRERAEVSGDESFRVDMGIFGEKLLQLGDLAVCLEISEAAVNIGLERRSF